MELKFIILFIDLICYYLKQELCLNIFQNYQYHLLIKKIMHNNSKKRKVIYLYKIIQKHQFGI